MKYKMLKGAVLCVQLSGCHIAGILQLVPRMSQALLDFMPYLQTSEGEKYPLRGNKYFGYLFLPV